MRVALLQLSGRCNCQDDAMPVFSTDSRSSVLVLSNDILFVSVFFLEDGKRGQHLLLGTSLYGIT